MSVNDCSLHKGQDKNNYKSIMHSGANVCNFGKKEAKSGGENFEIQLIIS